jgi:hypothetical protein
MEEQTCVSALECFCIFLYFRESEYPYFVYQNTSILIHEIMYSARQNTCILKGKTYAVFQKEVIRLLSFCLRIGSTRYFIGLLRVNTWVCPYSPVSEKKDQQNKDRRNNIGDIKLNITVLNPA